MIRPRGQESCAMRVSSAVVGLAVVALTQPATAVADYVHTVMPGESLTSVAAADGLSVQQLAAANGLSPTAQLVTGMALQIPPQGTTPASGTIAVALPTQAAGTGDGDGD